jgi:hypothetical protein
LSLICTRVYLAGSIVFLPAGTQISISATLAGGEGDGGSGPSPIVIWAAAVNSAFLLASEAVLEKAGSEIGQVPDAAAAVVP